MHLEGVLALFPASAAPVPRVGIELECFVDPAAGGRFGWDDHRAFQERLLGSLRADPHYAAHAATDAVVRNRQLVRAWDALSLGLCMGLSAERRFEGVPAAGSPVILTVTPTAGDATRVRVSPWPFRASELTLVVEGRRLQGSFDDEAAMRAALREAPWTTITIDLLPDDRSANSP